MILKSKFADDVTIGRVRSFIDLLPSEQMLALFLLDQAKKLKKVCPNCQGTKEVFMMPERGTTWAGSIEECPRCHGIGTIPIEAGDVDLVKWFKLIEEAPQLLEEWGAYVSEYFQEKWDLQGDIDQYKEAVEGLKVAEEDVEVRVK